MTLPTEITNWLSSSLTAINRSMYFMLWNTFLALIPYGISCWIFRGMGSRRRLLGWWIGLIVFMAFLPNAPYVLTDVIHLVRYIRQGAALPTIIFIWIPQFFLFMLIGCEAYTLSLINLGHYLAKQGWSRWILPTEFLIHGLCSVGIYLGRFPRFNSWDLVANPGSIFTFILQEMTKPQPVAVMLMMFVVMTLVYWPLKHLSFAVALYWRSNRRQPKLSQH